MPLEDVYDNTEGEQEYRKIIRDEDKHFRFVEVVMELFDPNGEIWDYEEEGTKHRNESQEGAWGYPQHQRATESKWNHECIDYKRNFHLSKRSFSRFNIVKYKDDDQNPSN